MQLIPLTLQGAYKIKFNRIEDDRGFFMRFYDAEVFASSGLQSNWEQESISFNRKKDTLRGIHFQMPPFVEAKLVRVTSGAVLDVLVDLRKESNTYGKWQSVELSSKNDTALYIPKGFGHGFRTLEDNTVVEYKIDVPYRSELASGIRWNDELLKIEWGVEDPVISKRDSELQKFSQFISPF